MLICNKCAKTLSEDSLPCRREARGETSLGNTFYERCADALCECGGDFVEATICPICENYYDSANGFSICEDCIDCHENVENALEIGSENTEMVAINGFVALALSNEMINDILCREAKKRLSDTDKSVKEFCEVDKYYFVDWIKKKRGIN